MPFYAAAPARGKERIGSSEQHLWGLQGATDPGMDRTQASLPWAGGRGAGRLEGSVAGWKAPLPTTGGGVHIFAFCFIEKSLNPEHHHHRERTGLDHLSFMS